MTDLVYDPVSGTMKPPSNTISQYDNDELLTDTDGGAGVGAPATGGATLTPIQNGTTDNVPTASDDVISTADDETPKETTPEEIATLPEPSAISIPGFDPNAAPLPSVEDAPAYEVSPEEQAWADMHSGNIQDILEQGGLGLSDEIQQLMMDKNNEALMARESEAIRVMKNTMARRGIDNWGLEFKNIQQIKTATTKGIAANIRDIQIQNAVMKMASFENALGMSAHFLDYLSQQSQLKFAPKMATWQMKQQAKLLQYQANVDIWKMKINQAYTVGNMQYAQQLADHGAAIQHQYDIELETMKLEAAEEAAATQGFWSTVGTVLGFAAMFFFL